MLHFAHEELDIVPPSGDLLFAVDWQIWIADGDIPLPYKYVLNTNDNPSYPQNIVLMSNWNIAVNVDDERFEFSPPEDVVETDFIRMRTGR